MIAVVVLAILASGTAFAVQAHGQEPIELQPTYVLMNGDEEMGLVYGLDYGWLILTPNDTLYESGSVSTNVETTHYADEGGS